ncbi:NAD/NADP transhydrogenase alpha subunit (plasmid) [Ensifer sp. WSM1721]
MQLQQLGHACFVEAGAGAGAGVSDDAYRAVGVAVVEGAAALFAETDVIVKVRPKLLKSKVFPPARH